MASKHVRSFEAPDEVIDLGKVRSEMVNSGGLTVSRDFYQPGWRWSIHVKPVVGTDSCEIRHMGFLITGRMHVVLDGGEEFDIAAGDLFEIPAGHDAWVVGDETAVAITWTGARDWLGPLEALNDRVLATIVLTDVVDSTGFAKRVGDRAWSSVVAGHESRMREEINRFRGREIKMTGDGVLAIFDGAARAIRCAASLLSAAIGFDLVLRAAVHTGEIEVSDVDIHGVAIHEVSRIMGVAQPGEVLVSETTAALARDAGVNLVDRGTFELRGLEGSRRLYALN